MSIVCSTLLLYADNPIIMMKFALLSALAIPSIHAFQWKWTSRSATCSGDPFRNVALSVTCVKDNYTRQDPTQCGVGDTAYAKGSLEAIMPFSNGQVIVAPSVAGVDIVWDKKTYGHLSNWLSPINGQKLGEAGYYTISYAMPLPEEEGSWPGEGWILDNLVTGHITVKNNGDCKIEGEEEEEWYPVYNYAMAGLVMCSAMVTGLLVKKTKRNCAEDSDDYYDDNTTARSYYEMTGGSGLDVV